MLSMLCCFLLRCVSKKDNSQFCLAVFCCFVLLAQPHVLNSAYCLFCCFLHCKFTSLLSKLLAKRPQVKMSQLDNTGTFTEMSINVCCVPHLNPSMAAQVEVELGRVCDGAVHRGACWDVAALPHLQGAMLEM